VCGLDHERHEKVTVHSRVTERGASRRGGEPLQPPTGLPPWELKVPQLHPAANATAAPTGSRCRGLASEPWLQTGRARLGARGSRCRGLASEPWLQTGQARLGAPGSRCCGVASEPWLQTGRARLGAPGSRCCGVASEPWLQTGRARLGAPGSRSGLLSSCCERLRNFFGPDLAFHARLMDLALQAVNTRASKGAGILQHASKYFKKYAPESLIYTFCGTPRAVW
jgi:hypothetical protein